MPARPLCLFGSALFFSLFLSLVAAPAAQANMAKWWQEGEGHGPLVPQSDTTIAVEHEALVFELAPALASANVTATYRMTNAGEATSAEIAFVSLAAETAETQPDPTTTITVDGEPAPFRRVLETDLLAPALDAWLAAHPDADRELARLAALPTYPGEADFAELRKIVPGCRGECSELVAWHRQRTAPRALDTDAVFQGAISSAAAVAIPDQVTKLREGWSTTQPRRALSWLTFRVELPGSGARTVAVKYRHLAGSDSSKRINQTFTYQYLLSPAKRWAAFGALDVEVKAPPDTELWSSIPLTRSGDTYRAHLAGLPQGELSLEVASLRSLPLGRSRSAYWLALLCAVAAVTVPTSIALGRVWARATSRAVAVLGCVVGSGGAAAVLGGGTIAALSAVFPARAFGFGYDAAFDLLLLLALFVGVSVVVSGIAAARGRPPPTRPR